VDKSSQGSQMASKPYSPEPSVVRDRLSGARAFSANVALSRVQGLLDLGMGLLVTAKRFDRDSRIRANCLNGAKRCQSRVEEDMWKFHESSEVSQLSAGLDRLNCEISALQ
jgi:hypothetical protein